MANAGVIHGSAGAMIDDAGSVLAALAVFFAFLALSAFRVGRMDGLIRRVQMQLPSEQGKTRPVESLLTRIGKSSVARTIGQRARLEERLLLAGEPASVEAVLGAKVMASIGVAALVAVLGVAAGLSVALLALSVPMVLAATRAPDFVLARRARTRQRRIAAQVPDLAELLVATTGAGLNPPLAFRRSAEVLEGPLGEELRVALRGWILGRSGELSSTSSPIEPVILLYGVWCARWGAPNAWGRHSPRRFTVLPKICETSGTREPRKPPGEPRQDALSPRVSDPSRVPPPDGGAGVTGNPPQPALTPPP